MLDASRPRPLSLRSNEGARTATNEGETLWSVGDLPLLPRTSESGLWLWGLKITPSGSVIGLDFRGEEPSSRDPKELSAGIPTSLGSGRTELPLAINISKVAFLISISVSSRGVRSGSEVRIAEEVRSEVGCSEWEDSFLPRGWMRPSGK